MDAFKKQILLLYQLAACSRLTAVLNLDKPISKKAWTKHARSIAENTNKRNIQEIYRKKGSCKSQDVLKNTGSITFDPLADMEKKNIEIALSVDGSWGSRGWTSQNRIVDVCFEETGKMQDVLIKSALCRQCSKMKEEKEPGDASYIDYLEWYAKQEFECLKNHEDSSGVSKYSTQSSHYKALSRSCTSIQTFKVFDEHLLRSVLLSTL